MTRSAFRRIVFIACGILAVAGVATAMRGTPWSPLDAFLDQRAAPESQQAALSQDAMAGSLATRGRTPLGTYDPSAIGSGGYVTGSSGTSATATKPNTPNFAADRLRGAFGAGHESPSASAGNLWRLMGLARAPAPATSQSPAPTTHATTPRQPKPPKAPHASPGGSTHPAPPVILIGNNATPVNELIGGGATGGPTGGNFDPGGGHSAPPGGGGGGGGISATPEPTSMLLIGTGLFGVALMMRRRRA